MAVEHGPRSGHPKANAFFYVFVMILVLSLVVWANGEFGKRERLPPWESTRWEKLAISGVSFGTSPTSLSITVIGIQGETAITINSVIVKNSTGEISQVIHMDDNPAVVPADGNETTVNVKLTSPLPSGERCTVTLVTTKGSSFVSAYFAAP